MVRAADDNGRAACIDELRGEIRIQVPVWLASRRIVAFVASSNDNRHSQLVEFVNPLLPKGLSLRHNLPAPCDCDCQYIKGEQTHGKRIEKRKKK